MIRDILEEYGFSVVTAADGAEALRLVEEAEPEVVLLDVNMPVLDGEGFVAAVRERGLRVPIVIMTAGSSAKRWATQLGADAYLSKPFELSSLIDATTRFAATKSQEPLERAKRLQELVSERGDGPKERVGRDPSREQREEDDPAQDAGDRPLLHAPALR